MKYQVMVMSSLTGMNLPFAVILGAGGTNDVPWICLRGCHCAVEWHDWQALMKLSAGLHHNTYEKLVLCEREI